jgi:hypothetical protein
MTDLLTNLLELQNTTILPLDLLEILLEDEPVPDLVGLDLLNGISSLGHGQDLVEDGLDALLGSELQHGVTAY